MSHRLSKHGEGEYAVPGGHLELGESFEGCAARELLEETGISVNTWSFAHAVNSVFSPTKHYVTIFMIANVPQDTIAHNTEPEKCAGWQWVDFDRVPEPMFLPLRLLLESSRGQQLFQ